MDCVGVWLDVDLKSCTDTIVLSCHLIIVAADCYIIYSIDMMVYV